MKNTHAGWIALVAAASLASVAAGARTSRGRGIAPTTSRAPQDFALRANRLDHDLRTPIGAMATALELLRTESPDSPVRAEALEVLERQVARLRSLTEELRRLSQDMASGD